MKALPSYEELHRLFEYRDGLLYHRATTQWVKSGTVAGGPHSTKGGTRWSVWVDGVRLHRSRVVFFMMCRQTPDLVDHINGNTLDDRIENLRSVDKRENGKNASRRSSNVSGVTGVHWYTRDKKWAAAIGTPSGIKNLGHFVAFEDAVAARKQAEIEYGYHPNHGREKST